MLLRCRSDRRWPSLHDSGLQCSSSDGGGSHRLMMQGNPFSGDNVRLPLFFCRRCTAPTRSEEAYLDELRVYVRQTEDDMKVSDRVYRKRLACCSSCSSLIAGTCRLCGCYVELRAALWYKSCPMTAPAWKAECGPAWQTG